MDGPWRRNVIRIIRRRHLDGKMGAKDEDGDAERGSELLPGRSQKDK